MSSVHRSKSLSLLHHADAEFHVYTDSEYLINGFYGKSKNKKNWNIWTHINETGAERIIKFFKVKSHSGDLKNEIVDDLARQVVKNPNKFKDLREYLGKRIIFLTNE